MLTNFEKVKQFNSVFGHPVGTEPQTNIFSDSTHIVSLRNNLIREEVSELLEAFGNSDVVEMIDALSDILYVAYGLLVVYGVDGVSEYREHINKKISIIEENGDASLKNITLDKNDKTNFEVTKNIMTHFFLNTTALTSPKNFFKQFVSLTSLRNLVNSYFAELEAELINLSTYCDKHNFRGVIDTTLEIIYCTYMLGILMGVNLDISVNMVHDSNMSKICSTEEEANTTVEWYKSNETRYDSPNYRKCPYGYVIFNESTGKILKNINYKPVDLSEFIS
jgi:predicted HAD superfamily Cof-like phosphohydrolase